jgi:DNA-binding HxlR family transcriptional regulator
MTLLQGPMRSAQLRQAVSPGLSYKAFSETVHGLQEKGLLERVEHSGDDGRTQVRYRLTEQGTVVVDLLTRVDHWAADHSRELPSVDLPVAPEDPSDRTGTQSVPRPDQST